MLSNGAQIYWRVATNSTTEWCSIEEDSQGLELWHSGNIVLAQMGSILLSWPAAFGLVWTSGALSSRCIVTLKCAISKARMYV